MDLVSAIAVICFNSQNCEIRGQRDYTPPEYTQTMEGCSKRLQDVMEELIMGLNAQPGEVWVESKCVPRDAYISRIKAVRKFIESKGGTSTFKSYDGSKK